MAAFKSDEQPVRALRWIIQEFTGMMSIMH